MDPDEPQPEANGDLCRISARRTAGSSLCSPKQGGEGMRGVGWESFAEPRCDVVVGRVGGTEIREE